MALIRRYGLYTIVTAAFIFMLYSLSFPYETPIPYKSYDWAHVPIKYPVTSMVELPTNASKLPRIQHNFKLEDATARKIREARRDVVRKQFKKAWSSYRRLAWRHDELRPISGRGNHFGGWAATLIGALDTLWIMGFKEEFTSAIRDVELIDFGHTDLDRVNVFEINARYLGGLLSAHELSGDQRLLRKAVEVGEMLYHAFDTQNHMPITRWDFRGAGEGKKQVADEVSLLEIVAVSRLG
jgi:mannosyl-oligosaccharide alpha-1,2-mannosidase